MVDETNFDYLEDLERQNKELKNKNVDYQTAISNTSFGNMEDMNQSQWQLETEDILDKIEHFLRGDIVETDADGNVAFKEQTNKDLVILNKYGVNSIMQILGNYINRNHILSYYDEERIYEILGDIGDELADFILCNYEMMGLDTAFKKSRYKLLVLNMLHIIESSYRRALRGETAKSVNTDVRILQTDPIGGQNRNPAPTRKFNLFSPKTWTH